MSIASQVGTAFGTGISKKADSFEAGKEAATRALSKLAGTMPDLGVVFCSSKYNYAEALKGVRSVAQNVQLIGCSSASEFTEESVSKDSIVCGFIASTTHKFFTGAGQNLSKDALRAQKEAVTGIAPETSGYPHKSAIILVDALSGKGEEVCAAAVQVLGDSVRFSGGAAADDLTFDNVAVFQNDKALKDGVALCMMHSKKPVSIGVRHGHLAISGPMTLTKARANVVLEIDGKRAFDVWKDTTRSKASLKGIDVDALKTASEIGAYLMQYEAGLMVGADYKVRAPLSVNPDGSINFACEMVEGSSIRIMESPNKACQINSARDAAKAAVKAAKGQKLAGAIVFDCICRNLILESDFQAAISEIKQAVGNIPVIGFATYGEIAMEIGQLSGFHNTTTVVLLIPE